MKFRGKITDAVRMIQFAKIIMTLAKFCKSCVVRLSSDKMYFIVSDNCLVSKGPMVWCTLDQNHFFDHYKMVGVSPEDNEIFLDFDPDMLAKSLGSLKTDHAISMKIKLTNKITPCLTLEIELPSASHSNLCVHDIPVEVIPRRLWGNYEKPKLPTFDIGIIMPSLKVVRNVVERMKTFSSALNIRACSNGTFVLQVENDMVNIATTFKDLHVEDSDEEVVTSARVDIKKFFMFLASEKLNPDKIVCNIVQDKLIHMFLSQEDLILHFFIPGMSV